MKQTIDVEKLLAWAWREELPKAGAARSWQGGGIQRAFKAVEKFGQYLTLIDCEGENRFGVVSDLMAMEEPHADAIRVYEAVRGLDDFELVMPDAWDPLGDLDDIEPERPMLIRHALDRVAPMDARGVRRVSCAGALIVKHAILGGAPDWEAEQPERRFVAGPNGRPLWFRRITVETTAGPMESEVDGWNATAKRPMAGAYRKTILDPDPREAACGRAEYEIWHAALGMITEALAGALEQFEVVASSRVARPWEGPATLAPRLLPNLAAAAAVPSLPRGEGRKRAVA